MYTRPCLPDFGSQLSATIWSYSHCSSDGMFNTRQVVRVHNDSSLVMAAVIFPSGVGSRDIG